MAAIQRFRSAFHGFNREDVVHYIEYMNNQHSSQMEQLKSQLQNAVPRQKVDSLQAQLDAALEKCAQLEEQLAQQTTTAANTPSTEELEAYRRAERTERLARERAQQIYDKANGILTDVALKAEEATANVAAIADQMASAKLAFQDAVESLRTIRPEDF